MIDIARLREINDLLGHSRGDIVIHEVAQRLQMLVHESDTVAHLGADEFILILLGIGAYQVPSILEKIMKLFEEPVQIVDNFLDIEVNIGFALYPEHGNEPSTLIQHADIALRIAKNDSTGFSIYNPDNDPFSLLRLKLRNELRHAINQKELILYYQPKIDVKTKKVTSCEALARWPHPTEVMISPIDFIPMIEQSG